MHRGGAKDRSRPIHISRTNPDTRRLWSPKDWALVLRNVYMPRRSYPSNKDRVLGGMAPGIDGKGRDIGKNMPRIPWSTIRMIMTISTPGTKR
jgi:hypothetical protein